MKLLSLLELSVGASKSYTLRIQSGRGVEEEKYV